MSRLFRRYAAFANAAAAVAAAMPSPPLSRRCRRHAAATATIPLPPPPSMAHWHIHTSSNGTLPCRAAGSMTRRDSANPCGTCALSSPRSQLPSSQHSGSWCSRPLLRSPPRASCTF